MNLQFVSESVFKRKSWPLPLSLAKIIDIRYKIIYWNCNTNSDITYLLYTYLILPTYLLSIYLIDLYLPKYHYWTFSPTFNFHFWRGFWRVVVWTVKITALHCCLEETDIVGSTCYSFSDTGFHLTLPFPKYVYACLFPLL